MFFHGQQRTEKKSSLDCNTHRGSVTLFFAQDNITPLYLYIANICCYIDVLNVEYKPISSKFACKCFLNYTSDAITNPPAGAKIYKDSCDFDLDVDELDVSQQNKQS